MVTSTRSKTKLLIDGCVLICIAVVHGILYDAGQSRCGSWLLMMVLVRMYDLPYCVLQPVQRLSMAELRLMILLLFPRKDPFSRFFLLLDILRARILWQLLEAARSGSCSEHFALCNSSSGLWRKRWATLEDRFNESLSTPIGFVDTRRRCTCGAT